MLNKKHPFGKGDIKWVSPEWLHEHLEDRNLLIIDTQPDIQDYLQSHIPNSVYINENTLRMPFNGISGSYVPLEIFSLIAGEAGLSPEIAAVIYTGSATHVRDFDGLAQTSVAYCLARFGHENIYILNGGLDRWKQENRRLTRRYPRLRQNRYPAVLRTEHMISTLELKQLKEQDDVILLDARAPHFYSGQGLWLKPGHIPGAVNLFWKRLMRPDNCCELKNLDEIVEIMFEAGATPEKTVICAGGTGREAVLEFIVVKWLLGYQSVKIYEGSFTQWCADAANPTVTGHNPRVPELALV